MDCIRRNNRGFSLVELIVIILIIGVLSGGSIAAVSSLYYADAERAAKKIVNLMSTARSLAMSSDGNSSEYIMMKLGQDADGNYIGTICYCDSFGNEITTKKPVSSEKISSYRVDISVGKKNAASKADVDATHSLQYTFKKASGGIDKSILLDTADPTGTEVLTGESIYVDIIVSGASTYQLIVVPVTGRCYLDGEL